MPKSDDWQTPPALMAALDHEFRFNLEVCASEENRALHPSVPYMGLDNDLDARSHEWKNPGYRTTAFCNPPYSMLPLMVSKAIEESQVRDGKIIVMLIPAYTDTRYFQDGIRVFADEVRLLKGRLAFTLNGRRQTTARFPSAVVIFRPHHGLGEATVRFWNWKV